MSIPAGAKRAARVRNLDQLLAQLSEMEFELMQSATDEELPVHLSHAANYVMQLLLHNEMSLRDEDE